MLPLKGHSTPPKLEAQRLLIHRLQKTTPQLAVDLHHRANDGVGLLIAPFHICAICGSNGVNPFPHS